MHKPGGMSHHQAPAEPFGPPPDYTGAPMIEDGSETLSSFEVNQPIVNFGVSTPKTNITHQESNCAR